MKIRIWVAATLLAASCQDEPAPTNANELTAAPAQEAGGARPALETGTVGPLRFSYNPLLLVPVETPVSVPPDWAREVPGIKLITRERAKLIGKAECLYGLSGRATVCNATQEAGIAFATVEESYDVLSKRLSGPLRRDVELAGRNGVSWTVGAEGEGVEHILLPAGDRAALIVRHFRASGNPPEEAIAAVLGSTRLASSQ
jgi:hypothetical protein